MKGRDKERALLAERFTPESPLRAHVITMSDRASAGVYEDKGGPLVQQHLNDFFGGIDVQLDITSAILPDDADGLRDALEKSCADGVHIIVTTGGTGVGPRDNTPEVVLELADKVIPGIMELIRMKYGADKPCALLSRTVAATKGHTLIYALPGSSKGVEEYMTEIETTIDHLLCVLHELEVHE